MSQINEQVGTAANAASPPTTIPTTTAGKKFAVARLRDFALVPPIILIMIVGYFINPVFMHAENLVNILQDMAPVGVLVLAETLVLLTGKMDLSLESTYGLAPGLAAWLVIAPGVTHGLGALPEWTAVPITLLVGTVIGALNGLLIVRFKLHGFVVTLGMLITIHGLLQGISSGQTFFGLPPSMLYLGTEIWFGVPVSVWLCVALFGVAILALGYTRSGRSLYAIGGNRDAAKAAGIRTDQVTWVVLIVASTLAALGGLMITGRLAAVAASQGSGAIFTVFAAAVIGGVSLNGGKGTMFGAFCGTLLLFMIRNLLQYAGVSATWIDFLNGVIILLALIITRITSGEEQE